MWRAVTFFLYEVCGLKLNWDIHLCKLSLFVVIFPQKICAFALDCLSTKFWNVPWNQKIDFQLFFSFFFLWQLIFYFWRPFYDFRPPSWRLWKKLSLELYFFRWWPKTYSSLTSNSTHASHCSRSKQCCLRQRLSYLLRQMRSTN